MWVRWGDWAVLGRYDSSNHWAFIGLGVLPRFDAVPLSRVKNDCVGFVLVSASLPLP